MVIGFFKDLCTKIPSFYGSNEWNGKAEFHNAEWRKCEIIPPKAEWLACLQLDTTVINNNHLLIKSFIY